jgi:hypothetical protein
VEIRTLLAPQTRLASRYRALCKAPSWPRRAPFLRTCAVPRGLAPASRARPSGLVVGRWKRAVVLFVGPPREVLSAFGGARLWSSLHLPARSPLIPAHLGLRKTIEADCALPEPLLQPCAPHTVRNSAIVLASGSTRRCHSAGKRTTMKQMRSAPQEDDAAHRRTSRRAPSVSKMFSATATQA